jgi:plastocyanin
MSNNTPSSREFTFNNDGAYCYQLSISTLHQVIGMGGTDLVCWAVDYTDGEICVWA